MLKDLDKNQILLAEFMSELSEEAYEAGWMLGLEYALWHAMMNGQCSYGRLDITDKELKKLNGLSASCRGWIYYDDNNEETFIKIESWKKMYSQNIKEYESKIS